MCSKLWVVECLPFIVLIFNTVRIYIRGRGQHLGGGVWNSLGYKTSDLSNYKRWVIAVMSSCHIIHLRILELMNLLVVYILWSIKFDVHVIRSLNTFITLTITSRKALYCNSLTVALYSKHLVLQVKNYFFCFVLKFVSYLGFWIVVLMDFFSNKFFEEYKI